MGNRLTALSLTALSFTACIDLPEPRAGCDAYAEGMYGVVTGKLTLCGYTFRASDTQDELGLSAEPGEPWLVWEDLRINTTTAGIRVAFNASATMTLGRAVPTPASLDVGLLATGSPHAGSYFSFCDSTMDRVRVNITLYQVGRRPIDGDSGRVHISFRDIRDCA